MKSLTKNYEINASPSDVYNALTDSETIAKWSGFDAQIDPVPGGKFSFFGGQITGTNKEVSKNKIVQDWYAQGFEAPSKVTFNIIEDGGKTNVELIHEEIPDPAIDAITAGWDTKYLGVMKEYLDNK